NGALFLDVLGAIACLIALNMTVVLINDSANQPVMSYGAAYLIYAAVTLGLFVLLTLTIYYLSGRFIGRMIQRKRIREMGKNLGRPV
ncbi:MAG: hypothetical protein QNJ29_01315, partial [Rhizobiaceae bacterium]|nr:hypothetical protein [Rhizobiaceae bacterium]